MVHAEIEQRLHSELYKLVLYVERLRQELADTLRQDGEGTKFENISSQLDAVVKNTETASNEILTSSEGILESVDKLRENNSEEEHKNLCDQIEAHATNTLQACSFQDITGQRVTKILRSIKFVEDRVSKMAEIYGETSIKSLGSEISAKETASKEELTDDVPLEGPALDAEQAISQDEIDALFD